MSGSYIVESPTLNKRFGIATNTPKVDAYCPIDRTQLVSVREYDFSSYLCVACNTAYQWGVKDPNSLLKQARAHISEVKKQAEFKLKELASLECIIQAAQQNGII